MTPKLIVGGLALSALLAAGAGFALHRARIETSSESKQAQASTKSLPAAEKKTGMPPPASPEDKSSGAKADAAAKGMDAVAARSLTSSYIDALSRGDAVAADRLVQALTRYGEPARAALASAMEKQNLPENISNQLRSTYERLR